MASKLAYIKHNLILENSNLFKVDRRRKIETSDETILNDVATDDIIVEDY